MKKIVPLGLASALLFGAVAIRPGVAANAQSAGLVSSILGRMQRNRQNLKSLSSRITMDKYNSQLRDSDRYEGNLKYIPMGGRQSDFVFLEWTKPQHETLFVANGQYWLYRPRLNQAIHGSTQHVPDKKDNDMLSLLGMSAAQLRAKFGDFQDVREETLWGGVPTWHFRAEPKGQASYKYIELWVDGEGMPVQTKMVQRNDDATTMRLTDLQKNVPISHDIFTPKLDSSVKVIPG